MNLLWEQFVLISLRSKKTLKVKGQNSKFFWKAFGGKKRTIRPDITITYENKNYVIDTKWKLVDKNPSIGDIRQMYAYHHYFNAEKATLIYPGSENYISGKFVRTDNQNQLSNMECGIMFTELLDSVKNWKTQIGEQVYNWIKS